jgi:hypothetical protein
MLACLFAENARMRTHSRIIIAHHLIWMGYGQWLANDIRGSGSTEIRKEDLEQLGPIHFGRKRIQPSREELRAFYRRANPLLDHEPLWINPAKRQAIADAFEQVIKLFKYTLYAFAICGNHAHGLPRRHRDDAETMWWNFAMAARDELKRRDLVPVDHPYGQNVRTRFSSTRRTTSGATSTTSRRIR